MSTSGAAPSQPTGDPLPTRARWWRKLRFLAPASATAGMAVTVACALLYVASRRNPDAEPLTDYCHERVEADLSRLPLLVGRIRMEALAKRIQLAEGDSGATPKEQDARAEVLKYLLNQLTSHESVAFMSIGTPDGRYYAADRVTEAGGQVTVLFCDPKSLDDGGTGGRLRIYPPPTSDWRPKSSWLHEYPEQYRPQTRPWYLSAVDKDEGVWVEPYLYVTNRDSGLNYSQAVYTSRGTERLLLGVVTASITIRQMGAALAGALKQKEQEEAGVAFLVRQTEGAAGRDYLLADSGEAQFRPDLLPASWPRRFQAVAWERVRAAPDGPQRLEHLGEQYVVRARPVAIDLPNERVYLVTCTRNRFSAAAAGWWLLPCGLLGLAAGAAVTLRPAARLALLEAELPKKERLIEVILETATEALFVKDRDGRYLYANKKCAQDVGQADPNNLIGVKDDQFFDSDSWGKIDKADQEVIRAGQPKHQREALKTASVDKHTFLYQITKTPWVVGGACHGLVGWAIDLSDRQHVVETLQLALDRVAHDMRTYFLPLELYCEYLPASYIRPARGCIADLDVMAADLMYFAELSREEEQKDEPPRTEHGSTPAHEARRKVREEPKRGPRLDLKPCALVEELDTLEQQQRSMAVKGHVELEFDIDGSCYAPFITDPQRLRHALGNVIGNAIKFSRAGSRHVTVRCRVEGDPAAGPRRLVCEVLDTGRGLRIAPTRPASDGAAASRRGRRGTGLSSLLPPVPGVVERSATEGSATPSPTTGLGLGLYITKSIVERLGGAVTSENRTDGTQGARFRIEVPEADRPTSEGTAHFRRQLPSDGELRILLVDDDPVFGNEIADRLRRHADRFRVDVATRSTAGVELWTQKRTTFEPPYHLVVTDYELPDMDGPRTAEALKTNHGLGDRTLLVCMTAALTTNRRQETQRAGITEVMQKSHSTANDLIALIEGRPTDHPPTAAAGVAVPPERIDELAANPDHVRVLVAAVPELRDLYNRHLWHELRNSAHKLGGEILCWYDLNTITREIEEGLAPNDSNPKDPPRADEGLRRLVKLVCQLQAKTDGGSASTDAPSHS